MWTAWTRGLQGDAAEQVAGARTADRRLHASSGGPRRDAALPGTARGGPARGGQRASRRSPPWRSDSTTSTRRRRTSLRTGAAMAQRTRADRRTRAGHRGRDARRSSVRSASARDQGARLLELRAATGLALHQRRIGDAGCTALEAMAEPVRVVRTDASLCRRGPRARGPRRPAQARARRQRRES